MTSKSDSKNRDGGLRRQTEKTTVKNGTEMHKKMEALTPEAGRGLLSELRVQQVELETRNEELRRTQEELQASREQYRLLVETSHDIIYKIDTQGIMTFVSPAWKQLLGHDYDAVVGHPFQEFVHLDDIPRCEKFLASVLETLEPSSIEYRVKNVAGEWRWHNTNSAPIINADGTCTSFVGIASDITDRKQEEEALGQEKEVLQTILDNIPVMIAYLDREGSYQWINRCWQSTLGWSIMEVMQTDVHAELYPDPEYRKYVADFIASSASTWGDFQTRARNERLLDTAWINVPLAEGSNLGIGIDISERKQAEGKLAKSYESLKKTFSDAIDTMVKIVEMRDPYTAGHQQRVARLAFAIATEMKLEDTRIDQLKIAAVIHDIGKMNVPSDILSKPGRLSDIEFGLIKTHAQNGYDIMKGMDFPCSVAQAVLQHHERLDGSGYPGGLKGKDILLEAKILAVADVIEAMYSYRPYRPAMGIDKALEEISNGRGKLYDPDVVDACLELFKTGRFEFEDV